MAVEFRGIIPATHTPMHPDGSLNLDAVPYQVELLLNAGVDGIFVCGTTGEFPSLTVSERGSIAEAFVRANGHRVPLIVHVGHNCVKDSRALAAHAAEIGADAIAACAPSYFKPDEVATLLDCCTYISDGAPGLPFFFYHIPVFTGVSLPVVELLKEAAVRLPSLVGVKYSSPTLHDFTDCIHAFDDHYTMIFGVDEMLLPALAAGAHAAVGSTYNYAAPLYRKLWTAFARGDADTARLCQYRSVQFVKLQEKYGGVRASKVIMKLVGMDCGPPRLPLQPFTPLEERALKEELTKIGFFDWINEQ